MIYSAFPSDKEKLDRVFLDLDKIVDLMGNVDEPMPFLLSGLKLLKLMIPYIMNSPKVTKLSKKYGDMTSSDFAQIYFEKTQNCLSCSADLDIRICRPCL